MEPWHPQAKGSTLGYCPPGGKKKLEDRVGCRGELFTNWTQVFDPDGWLGFIFEISSAQIWGQTPLMENMSCWSFSKEPCGECSHHNSSKQRQAKSVVCGETKRTDNFPQKRYFENCKFVVAHAEISNLCPERMTDPDTIGLVTNNRTCSGSFQKVVVLQNKLSEHFSHEHFFFHVAPSNDP